MAKPLVSFQRCCVNKPRIQASQMTVLLTADSKTCNICNPNTIPMYRTTRG